MVISHSLRYVYIGIPRTSSKSMIRWLCTHYEGKTVGSHHEMVVPEEARDYLIFTIVRNPYDRHTSGAFSIPWGGKRKYGRKYESLGGREAHESLREQVELPKEHPEPLEERIKYYTLEKDGSGVGNCPTSVMNQWYYCKAAGVTRVLLYERLPRCLKELSFVTDDVPEYTHALERGIRPPGTFFDHFDEDEETVVWAYESETFEGFGYRRFDAGLPASSPNSLIIG